jgi:alginate O-acetyltransferase complex protein AlgI
MLFNSPIFLFAFLPIAVLGFYGLGRLWGGVAARVWLVGCSLFFYTWAVPQYAALLIGSILFNFAAGRVIERAATRRKTLLTLAIGANLAAIGYFKYANFFVQTVATSLGLSAPVLHIILPLAISFFTFQQIAYLVNAYRRNSTNPGLLDYACFITFFPHLIAGPIVQHSDILPQFRDEKIYRLDLTRLSGGLTIFLLGLAKKVILADEFGNYANAAFDGAAGGAHLSLYEAWGGALAYTFQLYFDFSGYSDMAIGLGLMFGIIMPMNFNSPYKSRSIIEFWRRWHMTLSRFLREFVYIPLGGNRKGPLRRHVNLFLTMLIGGLWHGAAWTFVAWGGFHGAMLVVNHGWNSLMQRFGRGENARPAAFGPPALMLTFVCVVLGWVMFRATSWQAAAAVYQGMAGLNGAVLPADLVAKAPFLSLLGQAGALPHFADGTNVGFLRMGLMLPLGLGICLLAPNIPQLSPRARWWLVALTFALVLQKVLFSGQISHFIYFQF